MHASVGSVGCVLPRLIRIASRAVCVTATPSPLPSWTTFITQRTLSERHTSHARFVSTAPPVRGVLWVAGTPIGNVQDASPRLKSALTTAALIAAEDTRVTGRLLQALDIVPAGRLVSCHEHNQSTRIQRVLSVLREGGDVVLVSDAGTPAISDPGAHITAAAARAGFRVAPIPGACAAVAALSVAGVHAPAGFNMCGFITRTGAARQRELLRVVGDSERPVVLYEAPHRILKTLRDLERLCKGTRARALTLCRELTKTHEEVVTYDDVASAAAAWTHREPLGEFVLVLHPCPDASHSAVDCEQAAVAHSLHAGDVAGESGIDGNASASAARVPRVRDDNAFTPDARAPALSTACTSATHHAEVGVDGGGAHTLTDAVALVADMALQFPTLKSSFLIQRVAASTGVRRKELTHAVLSAQLAAEAAERAAAEALPTAAPSSSPARRRERRAAAAAAAAAAGASASSAARTREPALTSTPRSS